MSHLLKLKEVVEQQQPGGGQHVGCCAPSLLAHGGEAGKEGAEGRREQGQEAGNGGHQAGQGCN